jgi:hypothetical protein
MNEVRSPRRGGTGTNHQVHPEQSCKGRVGKGLEGMAVYVCQSRVCFVVNGDVNVALI